MSGAGDPPARHDERLACHRVCDGERCRGARGKCGYLPSQHVSKVHMSSLDEDTRATQGGCVTSAILSASCTTSSKETCACVAIMA